MCKTMVGLGACLILMLAVPGSLAQDPDVEVSPVNTAADLDLSGEVIYAINFGNSGNPTFGDLVFSQDQDFPGQVTLACTAEDPVVPSWYGVNPNTGDPNLDLLLGSGAWTNNGAGPSPCTRAVLGA